MVILEEARIWVAAAELEHKDSNGGCTMLGSEENTGCTLWTVWTAQLVVAGWDNTGLGSTSSSVKSKSTGVQPASQILYIKDMVNSHLVTLFSTSSVSRVRLDTVPISVFIPWLQLQI